MHSTLYRAQGVTPKHLRRQQVSQTHSSRQKRPTEFIEITKANWPRIAESRITTCNKIIQKLITRVVHSVIKLIEQTPGINLPSEPQTTNLSLTLSFRTANNTIQQAQMRLSRRHPHRGTILQAGQNVCIETALERTWTVK